MLKQQGATQTSSVAFVLPQILNWKRVGVGCSYSGKVSEPKPSQCKNELELTSGWPQNQGWAKSSPAQQNKPEMLDSPISPEDLQSF